MLIPRLAALAALLSIASSGGCDWFADPMEANLAPTTTITTCPSDVTAGDDVTFEWTGSDIDGTVVEYRWSFDDTTTGSTEETSLVVEDVAEGDHTFEVAAVDDDGDADLTPAVCEFTANAAGGLVKRVVLAEFLTTQPCTNCPNAETALAEALDEYGADSLCIISYHAGQFPTDPVATPETVARIDWYEEEPGVPEGQFPIVIFDGDCERAVVGAATVGGALSNYEIEINQRKSIGSPVTVDLSGGVDGSGGDVTARVHVRDPLEAGTYVLRTVVIENFVSLGGPYHDYGYVARDILDDTPLTVSAVGDSAVVQMDFSVDSSWDVDELDVIAFVQNDDTKEVLQAGRLNAR